MAQIDIEQQKQYAQTTDALPGSPPQNKQPGWDQDKFFEQRSRHRSILFWSAIILSGISLLLIIGIVGIQAYMRIVKNDSFEVLDNRGLEIVAVAVFGQIFGVIYIVAKSVWSNDEFRLMNKG